MTNDLKLPTVHINGSSRELLLSGYEKARDDLRTALGSMENVELNGRDYYMQEGEAFRAAVIQHSNRKAAIKTAFDEISSIVEHLTP